MATASLPSASLVGVLVSDPSTSAERLSIGASVDAGSSSSSSTSSVVEASVTGRSSVVDEPRDVPVDASGSAEAFTRANIA